MVFVRILCIQEKDGSASSEPSYLLYRKDRLRRSLELKWARMEAGTLNRRLWLEDIKTFFGDFAPLHIFSGYACISIRGNTRHVCQ